MELTIAFLRFMDDDEDDDDDEVLDLSDDTDVSEPALFFRFITSTPAWLSKSFSVFIRR